MSELPEHLRLSVLLGVLLRIDNHVHPIALFADPTSGNEIGTQRIILGQISRKIHLLPFKLLAKVLFPWEAKLAQMPPLDEVNLAIRWRLVDFIWMSFET